MSDPNPTEIQVHQKSRIFEISFDDGTTFKVPCELLRVYSPSAEVQGHGPGEEVLQLGKEDVTIDKIEQMGNYAVKLTFSDGHDTGLYSWETLYNLGAKQEELWKDYLDRLKAAGHTRREIH